MTVGLAVARANARLEVYRNSADSAIANVYVKLHTGDPGSDGTSNASTVTTRNEVTWNAASSGSMTLDALSDYSMTASETISHVSLWDASTAGNFLESIALDSGVPVINGSTLTFSTLTIEETPIAA
jgi:hypothetical protein